MKILPFSTETFFKKAVNVAECYGFSNVDDLRKKATAKGTTLLGLQKHKSEHEEFAHHVLADVFKHYSSSCDLKQKKPLMFYTPSTVSPASTPSVRISALTLNTVGTNDPLAEIVLLKSATSILRELGIKKFSLRINSIGDSDSSVRFLREATLRIRNRMHELPVELSNSMRANPGAVFAQLYSEKHPLAEELPSPIEYLTTPSRKYFKEVLELLGNADIPFELSDKLYANPNIYSHTIFEIVEINENEAMPPTVLARGGRYDELTRPYVRGTLPSTGIVIAMRTNDKNSKFGRPRRRKANACLVHIGKEARIRSINIIETFRARKIPIEQCLYFERFSEQMAYAEAQHTKYILIIGQQEARDNVVLMRNTNDHSQQTVSIDRLPELLGMK
ncbi:MAG: histidyl-tRNA synthetase [Parcubacteria group bacterium GW2011_GWA2_43_11]|nr:MAG: histidyl-tRNA synthetase [Parcubacteria group bacterium GW2011_GWC2_42_11]KKS86246.1 MAG: histidyl-tRNA synthetase [Parcubacteria group bacterium GW2011_GWA2_43_11]